jgi:hypothetical protein
MAPMNRESKKSGDQKKPGFPKNGPPAIEEVLQLKDPVEDPTYDVFGSLDGVKGTWHRLWSAMSLRHTTNLGDRFLPDELLHEFETKFGRGLTPDEIQALDNHARQHAETVMKPLWDRRPGGPKDGQA